MRLYVLIVTYVAELGEILSPLGSFGVMARGF